MIDNRDWRNMNWLWGKFLELICIDIQGDIIPAVQPKSFKPNYSPHICPTLPYSAKFHIVEYGYVQISL